MPADDEQRPPPLYAVSFALAGSERQAHAWSTVETLASAYGIQPEYRRGHADTMAVIVRGDQRADIDAWAAAVAEQLASRVLGVEHLPVRRWRVLVRLPDDQHERYDNYIGDTYPTGMMELDFEVDDPSVPEGLHPWYVRTADREMLADMFEDSCAGFSGEVVAIEEFPESTEEQEATAKLALHARLIDELFPAEEQALASVLGAIIQDHLDGQPWEELVEEFRGQAVLLMMFPELRSVASSQEDPAAAMANHLIARCRTIVEHPTGPWVGFLARLPRTPT